MQNRVVNKGEGKHFSSHISSRSEKTLDKTTENCAEQIQIVEAHNANLLMNIFN